MDDNFVPTTVFISLDGAVRQVDICEHTTAAEAVLSIYPKLPLIFRVKFAKSHIRAQDPRPLMPTLSVTEGANLLVVFSLDGGIKEKDNHAKLLQEEKQHERRLRQLTSERPKKPKTHTAQQAPKPQMIQNNDSRATSALHREENLVRAEKAVSPIIAEIQRSIATPGDSLPVPYSDGANALPTSLTSLKVAHDVKWLSAIAPATQNQLPSDQMVGFAFRDPLRFSVQYDANKGHVPTVYNLVTYDPSIGNVPEFIISAFVGDFDLPIAYAEYAAEVPNTYAPHGAFLYPGRHDGRTYIWIDKGSQLRMSVIDGASDGTYKYAIFTFIGGDDGADASVAIDIEDGEGSTDYVVPESAYYAVKSVGGNPAHVLYMQIGEFVGATFTWNSHWAHSPMPGINEKLSSLDGIRVHGVSIDYSPRMPPLDAQGDLWCAQVPSSIPWTDLATDPEEILGYAQRQNFTSLKGTFGFLKPNGVLDFAWINNIRADAQGLVQESYFDLDSAYDYLVICAFISNADGQDARWLLATGIEFKTTDVWFGVMQPSISPDIFDQAIQSLAEVPAWHENPSHLGQIWSSIKQTASDAADLILKYGPAFAGLVGKFA